MPFSALGLSPALTRAVAKRGYSKPTAVQFVTIPAVLRGEDVWAAAQTGSGKTAAFALPILAQIETRKRTTPRRLHAVILAPTRELAAQIGASFDAYGHFFSDRVKVVTAFGGVSINPQLMALRGGAEIVVATPGRLLDVIAHNGLRLEGLSTLVLDEADRLLDLGFSEELGRILSLLPKRRQTLLFSATFPPTVRALAETWLREPTRVELTPTDVTLPSIIERAIEVDVPQRTPLLRHLIQENAWAQVLVFVATQYTTEHVAEKLRRAGMVAGALHGEMSQGARTQALADFKEGKLRVLIATDLAARGLDIVQLPVVVNYDLPRSAIDYVHRIGRTARAGASGIAISFVSAATHAHFQLIEKRNGRRLPREQIPGFEPTEMQLPSSPPGGGVKGKRKSKKDKLREAAARDAQPEAQPPKTPGIPVRWDRSTSRRRFR